jgi:hypothetical protein
MQLGDLIWVRGDDSIYRQAVITVVSLMGEWHLDDGTKRVYRFRARTVAEGHVVKGDAVVWMPFPFD